MTFEVAEKTSAYYTAVLLDELGIGIGSAQLTTLTLTLHDAVTLSIINGRNAQNALNTNGVTIDASGNLAWTMTPADNIIVTAGKRVEQHVATFQVTWSGGTKGLNKEVLFNVMDLVKVT